LINPFKFKEPQEKKPFILEPSEQNNNKPAPFTISANIEENEKYIKDRFQIPLNNDIIFRKFEIKGGRKAFAIFIEGMVNSEFVSSNIIETLQYMPLLEDNEIKLKKEEFAERFISHCQATMMTDIDKIIDEVNFGGCGIFIDGVDAGFSMDVRSWGHRGIDRPENEQTVYGPQEAFNEMLRNNSALIRKILKTEKVICKAFTVGTVSKTRGVIMYIDDIANTNLINEVERRIEGIETEYIFAVEEVADFIRDSRFSVTNQILTTERPDRTARFLAEGRVAILLNGSPNAIICPTNAFELTHAASDAYMNTVFANMARTLRLIGMLLSVLLPGVYLALTLFHQEMIPTYLLYSISSSRENVPFPSIVELILMDISFELIREAGLRMPGALGSTLGIVGGLILGQAAVSAKIVSPIMIIIIALTGIGSFATSNYSLGWAYRILRLIFTILGASLGFFGISTGIFLYSVYIASLTSFGTSFLSPLPGRGMNKVRKSIFMPFLWNDEYRPDYLKTKNIKKEAKISRPWLFGRGK